MISLGQRLFGRYWGFWRVSGRFLGNDVFVGSWMVVLGESFWKFVGYWIISMKSMGYCEKVVTIKTKKNRNSNNNIL